YTAFTVFYTLSLHDALPISVAGDNEIVINGELYTATEGFFTVYGDQTTGDFANSYTWPAADLGIEEDLPVSEWQSYVIVEDESGDEFVLVTGFDVPYTSATASPAEFD